MRKTLTLCIVLFLALRLEAQIKATNEKHPFILGVTETMRSGILSEERTLNIYLPPGYNKNDTSRYPVVYLLDGSADEDFIHVVGLFQYNNFPWIDRVPESIIVGIANVDRKRDFTFPTSVKEHKASFPTTGGSDRFIRFMEQELQPYINQTYRTSASRMIIGQSLGGLLATEILLKKPSLFEKYIIISPSLWWDNGSLLNYQSSLFKAAYTGSLDIYIGVGKEGLTPGPQPRVMEVDANLLADKLKQVKGDGVHVYFDYLQAEDHATAIEPAIFNALRILYPAKK